MDNIAFLHGIHIYRKYVTYHDIFTSTALPSLDQGEAKPSRATSSCLLKILRGSFLIRSVILALLALVAAVLIAINYVWKGEWSKARAEDMSQR